VIPAEEIREAAFYIRDRLLVLDDPTVVSRVATLLESCAGEWDESANHHAGTEVMDDALTLARAINARKERS
jgi:hypothetical protein